MKIHLECSRVAAVEFGLENVASEIEFEPRTTPVACEHVVIIRMGDKSVVVKVAELRHTVDACA